jgi:formylmethanofuran dehydrogenase subunit E
MKDDDQLMLETDRCSKCGKIVGEIDLIETDDGDVCKDCYDSMNPNSQKTERNGE